MARVNLTFRQRDVTAAIKAAKAAGHTVRRVLISKDGIITVEPDPPALRRSIGRINQDRDCGSTDVWLYIMAEGRRSPVKCGISSNPKKRVQELRLQSGRNLNIVFCHPLANEVEARLIEAAAHNALAAYRVHGEWFQISPKKATEIAWAIIETKADAAS